MADALFREIWPTLHQLAVRQLSRERYVAPVSPTELINELWLRNLHRGGWKIASREHFYAIVAVAMRRVLIDLARQRLALARGSGQIPASVEDGYAANVSSEHDFEQIVDIGILMDQLQEKDPLRALIADMYLFRGYTFEEIAQTTGLTVRQVSYSGIKLSNS